MDNMILQCIGVRMDFFKKHYNVPADVQPDVDAFIGKMYALGETATDAQDFEAKFAAEGLQEQLNGLLMRCTPVPYRMTTEEKAVSRETTKEIFREDRSRIAKEAAKEALDHTSVMAEEELIALKRKAMIEAGVYDDYTRASNALDIAKDAGGFLKNLFKKKK